MTNTYSTRRSYTISDDTSTVYALPNEGTRENVIVSIDGVVVTEGFTITGNTMTIDTMGLGTDLLIVRDTDISEPNDYTRGTRINITQTLNNSEIRNVEKMQELNDAIDAIDITGGGGTVDVSGLVTTTAFNDFSNTVSTNENTLTNRIATAEGRITTNSADIMAIETMINTLRTDVGLNDTHITNLTGSLNALQSAVNNKADESRVATLQANLQSQIDSIVAGDDNRVTGMTWDAGTDTLTANFSSGSPVTVVIPQTSATDLSAYYTSAQTNNAITSAINDLPSYVFGDGLGTSTVNGVTTVSTSFNGNYSALAGKPTILTQAQVQALIDNADTGGVSTAGATANQYLQFNGTEAVWVDLPATERYSETEIASKQTITLNRDNGFIAPIALVNGTDLSTFDAFAFTAEFGQIMVPLSFTKAQYDALAVGDDLAFSFINAGLDEATGNHQLIKTAEGFSLSAGFASGNSSTPIQAWGINYGTGIASSGGGGTTYTAGTGIAISAENVISATGTSTGGLTQEQVVTLVDNELSESAHTELPFSDFGLATGIQSTETITPGLPDIPAGTQLHVRLKFDLFNTSPRQGVNPTVHVETNGIVDHLISFGRGKVIDYVLTRGQTPNIVFRMYGTDGAVNFANIIVEHYTIGDLVAPATTLINDVIDGRDLPSGSDLENAVALLRSEIPDTSNFVDEGELESVSTTVTSNTATGTHNTEVGTNLSGRVAALEAQDRDTESRETITIDANATSFNTDVPTRHIVSGKFKEGEMYFERVRPNSSGVHEVYSAEGAPHPSYNLFEGYIQREDAPRISSLLREISNVETPVVLNNTATLHFSVVAQDANGTSTYFNRPYSITVPLGTTSGNIGSVNITGLPLGFNSGAITLHATNQGANGIQYDFNHDLHTTNRAGYLRINGLSWTFTRDNSALRDRTNIPEGVIRELSRTPENGYFTYDHYDVTVGRVEAASEALGINGNHYGIGVKGDIVGTLVHQGLEIIEAEPAVQSGGGGGVSFTKGLEAITGSDGQPTGAVGLQDGIYREVVVTKDGENGRRVDGLLSQGGQDGVSFRDGIYQFQNQNVVGLVLDVGGEASPTGANYRGQVVVLLFSYYTASTTISVNNIFSGENAGGDVFYMNQLSASDVRLVSRSGTLYYKVIAEIIQPQTS